MGKEILPVAAEMVYISPKIVKANKNWSIQFSANVTRKGIDRLETFYMECSTEKEASKQRDGFADMIKQHGQVLIFNPDGFPKVETLG